MSIFLIKSFLQSRGSRPRASRRIMSIFLIKCVLKAQGSRPEASRRIKKVSQSFEGVNQEPQG